MTNIDPQADRTQPLGERQRHCHRTVSTAGTADPDRQVAFTCLDKSVVLPVARRDLVSKPTLSRRVGQHRISDRLIMSRQLAQAEVPVRVGEKADIDAQVEIRGDPALEPKGDDVELNLVRVDSEGRQETTQLTRAIELVST